jgi:hypothetical protein
VTNERDIPQAARLMIELYGDSAEAEAAQMADMTRLHGDYEGTRLWYRIRRAIEFLRPEQAGTA